MNGALARGLSHLGFVSRAVGPSLLFYGSNKEAFEAIAPVLVQDAGLVRWLNQRFPEHRALMAPINMGWPTIKFFKRLRIRVVILLEDEIFPSRDFRQSVNDRSVLLVLMSGRGVAHLKPRYSSADRPSLLLAVDHETTKATDAERCLTLVPSASGRFDETSALAAIDHLLPLAGKNVKWTNRRDRPFRRSFARWLHRRLDDPSFAKRCQRFVKRYDDLDQLRRQLGCPETILCLGNGPSSEDPRLGDVAYGALFRVNHSWSDRPILTNPDVVFTGGPATMKAIKTPIFGLQDQIGELLLLANKGASILWHRLISIGDGIDRLMVRR